MTLGEYRLISVIISLVAAALLVVCDQLLKIWAVDNLRGQLPLEFIKFGDKPVINLNYLENRGAAFGSFSGNVIILVVLTAVMILLAVAYLIFNKKKRVFLSVSLTLIIAGGIGNLIDRIAKGYVVDYIEVKLFKFAVFNFADMCIVIGAVLMMIYFIFMDREASKTKYPNRRL